jgi:thiamine-monophosphate kinase
VAILGELHSRPVLRSGAMVGDLLSVTGELGAGAAGLLALESDRPGYERLVRKYLRPEPRIEAGRIAAELGANAMMDLSDGLASDVRRVCDRSGVGCDVDLDLLPIQDDTRELVRSLGQDPAVLAATGGEDYELLIAAPERVLDGLAESIGVPLTRIGQVTQKDVAFRRGPEIIEGLSGWDHFA